MEDFCWVLEPERLCQLSTGITWPGSWEEYMALFGDNEEAIVKIERHRQFADYFLLQIQVLKAMVENRSYNVIRYLQGDFSYTSLIALCANGDLPYQVILN